MRPLTITMSGKTCALAEAKKCVRNRSPMPMPVRLGFIGSRYEKEEILPSTDDQNRYERGYSIFVQASYASIRQSMVTV